MKKCILIFAAVILFGGFTIGQETITWRFAKPQVVIGSPDIFQFDVEVKADVAGTFHRDMQIYFDYNTAAFGTDIVLNGKITVSNLALMDPGKYSVVNSADNTASKFAVITEGTNEMSQNGSSAFFTEVPTTFTGFLRFQIEIANGSELAGIVFDEALMNGGQYKQDVSSTDPIKYTDPCLYDNSLLNSPLDGIMFSNIKCFLEGPYDTLVGSTMKTDLLVGPYLPTSQPYNPSLPYYANPGDPDPVWLYTGTETIVSFPANTVDWVYIQFRNGDLAENAGSVDTVATCLGFLLSNGTVVDLNGNPISVKLNTAYTDNLYMTIFHRNHLGIISNNGMDINSTGEYLGYDFSSAESQVYGGLLGHRDLGSGVWGMVAGDGDGNGVVQLSDKNIAWTIDLGFSGYKGGDFDMNGIGQLSDKNTQWKNGLGSGGQVPAKNLDAGYTSQVPK